MAELPVVPKVSAFITRGEELLVFTQPEHPEAGVQVPAGTMEPAEEPIVAALREAAEETGRSGFHSHPDSWPVGCQVGTPAGSQTVRRVCRSVVPIRPVGDRVRMYCPGRRNSWVRQIRVSSVPAPTWPSSAARIRWAR